jgi:hypothetical protein
MQDRAQYLKYAEEYERLARSAPESNKAALLEIANAWRQLADGKQTYDKARNKGQRPDIADG